MSNYSAPSLRDVAKRAGVSHQTVSRVINDYEGIRPGTRQRVLDAIEELNYRPNTVARALATSRSNRIGVLVDTPEQFGPMNALRGVEAAAWEVGYAISSMTVDGGGSADFQEVLDFLVRQGVDALCIVAPRTRSLEALATISVHVPVVVIESAPAENLRTANDRQLRSVTVDQVEGARLATEHLIDLGHTKIVHLAGPPDWLDAQRRSQAWEDVMKRRGLEVSEPIVGDWSADFGYNAASTVLKHRGTTAVFAANDQMALGLIHGLSEKGMRVPDDISVVGFDDIPEARHFLPPLTTVRQDFAALGRSGVSLLLKLLAGDDAPDVPAVAPALVVRESTAAVKR